MKTISLFVLAGASLLAWPGAALCADQFIEEADAGPMVDTDAGPPVSAEGPTPQLEGPPLPSQPEPASAASTEVEQAGPEEPALKLELEEPEDGWLSRKRYVAGGVVGSALSFGTGHIVVGEWTEFGWFFTTTQLLGAGLMVGGPILGDNKEEREAAEDNDWPVTTEGKVGQGLLFAGVAIFAASYIWEKIDLFHRPHNRLRLESESEDPSRVAGEGTISEQPDQPWMAEHQRSKYSEWHFRKVERATGREMDGDLEDYLESDAVNTKTFIEYVHRRYHKQRVGGIVLATVATPILFAASGVSAGLGALIGGSAAPSIGIGVAGCASLGFGIWLAVRGLRIRDAVEPLLDKSPEEASVQLQFTLVSDANGLPSGAGLSLTF